MKSQLFVAAATTFAVACSSPSGDPSSTPNPTPLGQGARVRDVLNPTLPSHPKPAAKPPKPGVSVMQQVNITGAVVTFIDTFDETNDGKSRGTIYVQDVGSQEPYSGVTLYKPTYLPADLRVAIGDVLDFNGPYEELSAIGTHMFGAGQVLPQLASPLGTFRYEYAAPDPRVVDAADLDDYNKGRQWLNMIVTVKNVTVGAPANDGSGRITYSISKFFNGASISNELYDLKATDIPPASVLKSVTGIVTWFDGYHIAPRSRDDLVLQ